MIKVEIFTDGSCLKNPGGPGGFGVIVRFLRSGRLYEKKKSCGYKSTTNNRMEVTAVLEGLRLVPEDAEADIIIYSDSRYVVDAFKNGWIEKWKYMNWDRGKNGGLVKNSDLWQEMLKLMEPHHMSFEWIKGHSGHSENDACDKMAVAAAKTQRGYYSEGYKKEKRKDEKPGSQGLMKSTKTNFRVISWDEFDIDELMAQDDTYLIIPAGSYQSDVKRTGSCKVLLSYGTYQQVYDFEICDCKNVNEVTLKGILQVIRKIRYKRKTIIILTGISFGSCARSQNSNSEIVGTLLEEATAMENKLEVIEVKNGMKGLKQILANRQ